MLNRKRESFIPSPRFVAPPFDSLLTQAFGSGLQR
jgi:hypothetical protein